MFVVLCHPQDGNVEKLPKLVFVFKTLEEAEEAANTKMCDNDHIVVPAMFA